jgi:hypothetical protein
LVCRLLHWRELIFSLFLWVREVLLFVFVLLNVELVYESWESVLNLFTGFLDFDLFEFSEYSDLFDRLDFDLFIFIYTLIIQT